MSDEVTFDLGIEVDDIQEAQLLPTDWYTFELADLPKKMPNKAMKKGPGEEGAGYNLVLKLKTYCPDQPEFNGRSFGDGNIYLPFPNDDDDGRFTPQGQPLKDSKAERIFEFATRYGATSGSQGTFRKGALAKLYVIQTISDFGASKGQVVNQIDTFAGVKPADE